MLPLGSTLVDMNSVTFNQSADVSGSLGSGVMFGLDTKPDGTRMYFTKGSQNNASIGEFLMTVPFDLSTLALVQIHTPLNFTEQNPVGQSRNNYYTDIHFNSDGTVVYFLADQAVTGAPQMDMISTYVLNSPYNVTDGSVSSNSTIANGVTYFNIRLNNLGFYSSASPTNQRQWTMGGLFNVNVTSTSTTLTPLDNDGRGIYVTQDGGQALILFDNGVTDTLISYSLTVPFSLASLDETTQQNVTLGGVLSGASGLKVDESNNILFITDGTTNVHKFNFNTASAGTGGGQSDLLGGLVNGFDNLFPVADDLSVPSQFGYVIVSMLIVTVMIFTFGYAMERQDTSSKGFSPAILWSAVVINILIFMYFVSISYIPIGVLIIFGLLLIAGATLKFFGGGSS